MNAPSSPHPTDDTLNSYGLGKLDDKMANAINMHLDRCTDCRERVAEMSADSFLGRIRSAQEGESNPGGPKTSGPRGGNGASVPPEIDTMPPGLANHPDYDVKRELGRGGMGVVYLAQNKLMGRDEVLKVMGQQIMERPGVLDRFLREIRAVGKLRHPNIVTAYSAVRLGEGIVFAMEYVEGLDLSKIIKTKGPLPVAHACNFAYQSALGLQHAHDEGLVHRDIKPGNLMLSRKGNSATIKILDFGLAKVSREEKVDAGLTHEGQALGTPDFIAPEQILDAATADIRADIYSLGCTLYYLLSGRPPFQANSLYDMFQAHISRDADPLNFVRPEVPAELAALVAKMMAKVPARRFQTPGEVAQALTPFFKEANAVFKRPELEVSQDCRTDDGRPVLGLIQTPTQPASDNVQPLARTKKAAERPVAETQWEGLIELGNVESPTDAAPTVAKSRRTRPPWVWAAVAGAAFLGLAVAFGVIIKLRMEDGGLLIIEVSEPGAEITLDKRQMAITWDASRKHAEIKVLPGEHMVEVTKDGFTAKGIKVAISEAGREIVKVFLQPADRDDAKVDPKPVASNVDLPKMEEQINKITVTEGKQATLVPKDSAFELQLDGVIQKDPRLNKRDLLVIPEASAIENVTVLDSEDAQNPFLPKVQFNKKDVTISGNLTVAMGGIHSPKMYITPPALAQIQISQAKKPRNGAARQALVLSVPDYIVDAGPDRVTYHFTDPSDPNVKHQKAVIVEAGSAGIDFPNSSDPDFFNSPQGRIALYVSGDPQIAIANMSQRFTLILQNVASVFDPTKPPTTNGVTSHQMGVDHYVNSRPELNIDLTKEYDVETMPIKPIRIKESSDNKATGKPTAIPAPD